VKSDLFTKVEHDKMNEVRKPEEFQDDRKKWNIFFDIEPRGFPINESVVSVRFGISRKSSFLTKEDIGRLKEDLKDLGKLRIIKQGKAFLKNESS
jgi:hypothetical protein